VPTIRSAAVSTAHPFDPVNPVNQRTSTRSVNNSASVPVPVPSGK